MRLRPAPAAALTAALLVAACSAPPPVSRPATGAPTPVVSASATPAPKAATPAPRPTPAARPRSTAPPAPPPPLAGDGEPRTSRLSIPALGISGLRVRAYRGSPDDARGTRIQDRGIAASPYGPDGGTGPGGIGNHIITAHRTSSSRAFADLPDLEKGDKVHLVAGGKRYTYKITTTRITSFRSAKSLAKQSAPVPRKPGVRPTKAMITLSTCRTQEDHAEGNYWADEFGNPEHRIDKIGELVDIDAA